MLSVVIATEHDERGLVATLASLVPASAAGVVRDVVLVDRHGEALTATIADAAGCHLITLEAPLAAALVQGVTATRSPWLLFLRPGAVLDNGWHDEVIQFVENAALASQPIHAVFHQANSPYESWSGRVMLAALRGRIFGATGGQGLLIGKDHYAAAGGHPASTDTEAAILRRLGRRARVTLRSRIFGPASRLSR